MRPLLAVIVPVAGVVSVPSTVKVNAAPDTEAVPCAVMVPVAGVAGDSDAP